VCTRDVATAFSVHPPPLSAKRSCRVYIPNYRTRSESYDDGGGRRRRKEKNDVLPPQRRDGARRCDRGNDGSCYDSSKNDDAIPSSLRRIVETKEVIIAIDCFPHNNNDDDDAVADGL